MVAAAAALVVAFATMAASAFVVVLFTAVAAALAFTVLMATAFVVGTVLVATAVTVAAAAGGGVDVIVLGTFHPGGGEAVAELHAADTGNGEEGVREAGFHAVPEGLSEPGGDAGNDALHDAAQRISFLLCLVQSGVPLRLVGDSADFDEPGVAVELDAAAGGAGYGSEKQFLSDNAGGDDRKRQTAGEMAAAARILEAAVLKVRGIVRMAGARDVQQRLVILAMGVRIVEDDSERSARRIAFIDAAEDLRLIGLHTRGRALRAAPATGDIRRKIRLAEGNARGEAVHDHADLLAVRFAEYAYSEDVAKSVHSLSNKSLKPGKDLATQAVSSMSTGPSAPSAATLRAITMR